MGAAGRARSDADIARRPPRQSGQTPPRAAGCSGLRRAIQRSGHARPSLGRGRSSPTSCADSGDHVTSMAICARCRAAWNGAFAHPLGLHDRRFFAEGRRHADRRARRGRGSAAVTVLGDGHRLACSSASARRWSRVRRCLAGVGAAVGVERGRRRRTRRGEARGSSGAESGEESRIGRARSWRSITEAIETAESIRRLPGSRDSFVTHDDHERSGRLSAGRGINRAPARRLH